MIAVLKVHEIYQVSMVWIRCSVIIYLKQTSSTMGNIACTYVYENEKEPEFAWIAMFVANTWDTLL
jgi:hypothetical protein